MLRPTGINRFVGGSMFIRSRVAKLAALCSLFAWAASADPLELHVDADYSINPDSADSIELGVRTALEEVDYMLGGQPVVLVPKDHRGNVKRSHLHMKQYLKSETALALIGGLHSPPYLTHKDFMNENGILSLLPWSAAGPITRASDGMENWIFRLSVDDYQSGKFFVRQAVEEGGCQQVALILLDTGWGRANFKSLSAALEAQGMKPVLAEFFPSSIGHASALTLAEKVARSGADCGIMLSNWGNGSVLVNALNQRMQDFRLFSHWGIMGGQFASAVPHEARSNLDLAVLQTCGLRREAEGSSTLKAAMSRAAPDLEALAQMPAPTGFVHGYDLARIVIAAADQIAETPEWQNGDIADRRRVLREALVNLETPVAGILNRYERPFRPYGPQATDAHEALGLNDLCLARFREDGLLEDAG